MSMFFGTAGELLTPLEDMMDGDIKLSLELGLELKDPLGGYGNDDWCGWSSSPSFDIFTENDCIMVTPESVMVSPETVMPMVKREVKQERPSILKALVMKPEPDHYENEIIETNVREEVNIKGRNLLDEEDEEEEEEEDEYGDEIEEVAEEDEEDDEGGQEEEDDDDEEEEVIKVIPKERMPNLWTPQVLTTRPTIVKTEPGLFQQQFHRQLHHTKVKSHEVVIPRTPPQTHLKVMHAKGNNNSRNILAKKNKSCDGYPKPAYSYSCLIAMALKNSITGSLPVAEIYNFMCEHFPYFKSARSGWKNSVRHNLSLNKCFEKIEKTSTGGGSCRKGCLWAIIPDKVAKMDDEVAKWSKKDPAAIRRSMRYPEDLERMKKGNLKFGSRRISTDSGAEDDYEEEDEEEEEEEGDEEEEEEEEQEDDDDSDDERGVPPSLKRFDSRLSSQSSSGRSSSHGYEDLGLPEEMYRELNILEEVMSEAKRPRLSPNNPRTPSSHVYMRHHVTGQV